MDSIPLHSLYEPCVIKVRGSNLSCKIMKICHIFTLQVDIENLLCEFEDTCWQIFLQKFH